MPFFKCKCLIVFFLYFVFVVTIEKVLCQSKLKVKTLNKCDFQLSNKSYSNNTAEEIENYLDDKHDRSEKIVKLTTCSWELEFENTRNSPKNKQCRKSRSVHKHRQRSFTPCFLKIGGNNLSHNIWYNRLKTHHYRTIAPKRSLKR